MIFYPSFFRCIVAFLCCISLNISWSADSTKVLFIGNSMTYFNDMPQLFRSISLSKGKNVSVSMYAPGGTGFVNHCTDPNVYALFRQEWDMVVLQPGTGESAGASWPVDTTIRRGRQLLDSVYTYNPCVKVFLYEIPYGVPSANDYPTYFAVQSQILDSVSRLSDSLKIPLLPAGECARAYYSLQQNLLLHGGFNDIHPNANGSFLIAAACFAGMFREETTGSVFSGPVQADTAVRFFSIADTVVLNRMDEWRLNMYNLSADFSYGWNAGEISFQDASVNASEVEWDFGDGIQSTDLNPVHTFTSEGTYWVTHYAFNGDCTDSISKLITVSGAGIALEEFPENWTLLTDPVTGKISLKIGVAGSIQQLEIVDLSGKTVLLQKTGNETELPFPELNAGIYVLRLSTENTQKSVKLRMY